MSVVVFRKAVNIRGFLDNKRGILYQATKYIPSVLGKSRLLNCDQQLVVTYNI